MTDNIFELTKSQFDTFINLPEIKSAYSYFVRSDGKTDFKTPRSLLGRRWLKYANVYYVVKEAE